MYFGCLTLGAASGGISLTECDVIKNKTLFILQKRESFVSEQSVEHPVHNHHQNPVTDFAVVVVVVVVTSASFESLLNLSRR